MKPLILICFVSAFCFLSKQAEAQVQQVNLTRPEINQSQQICLELSLPDRIRFEAVLIDSLLKWTNSLECSYRAAGFLSSTNDRLLLNRAHLLADSFLGDMQQLQQHLADRLVEILADFDLEHLYEIKETQWNIWINNFIQWVPKLEIHRTNTASLSTSSFNPMKHFSYYGMAKSY